MKEIFRIIKEWLARDHTRLVLFIGIFSAGIMGYSLGILRTSSVREAPLTMNIVAPEAMPAIPEVQGVATSKKATSLVKSDGILNKSTDCAFVGSKNSNLYHLPSCASARRIKDENRRCFASTEDAASKGYRPGCLK